MTDGTETTKCLDCRDHLRKNLGARERAYIELKKTMGPCIICGDDNPLHLEFNHIDPALKTAGVSQMNTVEGQYQERNICNCMCKKCHNIHTATQRGEIKERAPTDRKRIAREFVNNYKISLCGCQNPNCKDKFNLQNLSFYEFDHIDFRNKFYKISAMVSSGYSIKLIKRELEKCILLCSYCHRLKTMADYPKRREYYINLERPIVKTKREKQEIKLTPNDVNEIRNLYNNNNISQKDLAIKFNVTTSTIGHVINNISHFDKEYIKTNNKKSLKRKITEEIVKEIRDEYNNKNISCSQLGEKYGLTSGYVCDIINNKIYCSETYVKTKNKKLTIDIVKEMRNQYNNKNVSMVTLAKKYDISTKYLNEIMNNKTHKDNKYIRTRVERRTKITMEMAKKIRKEYNNGKLSFPKIAEKYGLSATSIRRIVANKSYTDPNYKRSRV